MAGETKGFLGGSMRFGVGDDDAPAERGPVLPLRVLIVGDFVPRGEHNAGASAPDAAVKLDPSRFDDIFTKLRPRLAVEVPSVLARGTLTRVDLAPSSLKSFRPDGLCAEVPLLRSLLDGRLVLERLRDGSLSVEQAASELTRLWGGSPFAREVLGLVPRAIAKTMPQTPRAKASSGEHAIDDILSKVDLGADDGGAPAPSSDAPAPELHAAQNKLSSLIDHIVGSARSAKGARPDEAIASVEKSLGLQIGLILQHPEVRRLERSYRGLKLVADRAQGHSGVKLEVASARPDEMEAAMVRSIRANAGAEPPVSVAIVDLEVDGSAASLARLEALAHAAEAYAVPAIVSGSARLLGVDDLGGVERLDHKLGLFEKPALLPWRSLTAKPALRWISVAMNGVLARLAYDKASSRVREAVVQEAPNDAGALVFIPPAYVVGALVVQSFKDTSWPCRIVGPKQGGVIENLPVREISGSFDDAEAIAIPTEAFLSTDTQRELGKGGVLAIASAPNNDQAIVMSAPTAYVTPPKRTYDSATTEPEARFDRVSLVDQLFVARLSQFLRALASKIPAKSDPNEVAPVVEAAIWTLFEDAKPGSLEVAVKARSDGGDTVVAATVRPRRFLGVQLEEVSLEVAVG